MSATAANPLPSEADALLMQLASANPEEFIAVFEAGATRILHDAGLVDTAALRPDPVQKPSATVAVKNQTTGWRIEHDATLPPQVRHAARILEQCSLVRYQLDNGTARDAVADTAVLYSLIIRALAVDNVPYVRAGEAALRARAAATEAAKANAEERAAIARRLYTEERERNPPTVSDTRVCEIVAVQAVADYPELFKKGYTGKAVIGLLKEAGVLRRATEKP